jgi:hypothetical protein
MTLEQHQEIFSNWVKTPESLNVKNQAAAASLLEKYPYCQILQFCRAKLEGMPELGAIYAPQGPVYQQFIQQPERLALYLKPAEENILDPLEKVSVKEADADVEDSVAAELKMREEQPEDSPLVDETEQLILESIASADFFALEEKAADATKSDEPEVQISSKEVSRYDDDQLPYTFLWWLNKTRNEHADTYQPYVSFKLDTSQQIKQRPSNEFKTETPIPDFDLNNLAGEVKTKTVKASNKFKPKNKAEEIIERFIQEEPQISPPSAEKMGSENKARKSAEDSLDLVSETLAQIYTEQMLLDKAIETYRKLSLKFPEKSTYFADQISLLESRKS